MPVGRPRAREVKLSSLSGSGTSLAATAAGPHRISWPALYLAVRWLQSGFIPQHRSLVVSRGVGLQPGDRAVRRLAWGQRAARRSRVRRWQRDATWARM